MVMVIQKQRIANIIIITNNFCYHKLVLKSIPGSVPDQAPLLAVGVAGHHQDGHGGSKIKKIKRYNHTQQLLLSQIGPKITSWGSP